MRRICVWLIALLLIGLPCLALADQAVPMDDLRVVLSTDGGTVEIAPQVMENENWLFLPAFAAQPQVLLSGREVQVQISAGDEEGVSQWQISQGDVAIATLQVMQGQNLRTLFLFSDDPVHYGRSYIEDCLNHENQATGAMAMVDAQGQVDHAVRLRQIRGRGNGTWERDKRPYQIKLVRDENLLDTSNPAEANDTWVLLSEATDGTLLHNRLALDLALEMGMEETSRSEFVDLYYDGEYRGVYLLAEKVEVAPGRVEETDYDALIETWNKRVGKKILDLLPVSQELNRYGNPYTFIEGVGEKQEAGAGAFFVELEHPSYTLSSRCWFEMSDGVVMALKNPENASQRMVEYISEKLEAARRTLQNGGVDPETGLTSAEAFDLQSFARYALIAELAYNIDALTYSSTWFVLPAGSDRFEAGPVWDFDLAWRYLVNGKNQNGAGLKNNVDWARDFYSDPTFVAIMRDLWLEEMAPLISDVLLGTQEGQYLKPLQVYDAHISASRRMDDRLWETYRDKRLVYGHTVEEEMALLSQFIQERSQWLTECFTGSWQAETLDLTFRAEYGYADTLMHLDPLPWPHVMPVFACTELSPATETDYARYRVDVYLSLADWSRFADPAPVVNGTALSYQILPDGRMHFAFAFEDPSYRPVEYDGMDVGRVYDYDQYLANHPEVVQICGTEPEKVLAYFFEEGVKQGHQGNAHIDAQRILEANPNLWYYFGEEWENYYWEYIYNGYDEHWIQKLGQTFEPVVEAVP